MPRTKSVQLERFTQIFFYVSVLLCLLAATMLLASLKVGRGDRPATGIHKGVQLSQGSATIELERVRFTQGSGHYKAPSGKRYAIISLSVANNSSTPFSVAAANDTYVKDRAGTTYYLSPTSLDEPFHSGQLLPGDSVRGELSYLLPLTGEFRFYVESDWSGGVVPFLLQ